MPTSNIYIYIYIYVCVYFRLQPYFCIITVILLVLLSFKCLNKYSLDEFIKSLFDWLLLSLFNTIYILICKGSYSYYGVFYQQILIIFS